MDNKEMGAGQKVLIAVVLPPAIMGLIGLIMTLIISPDHPNFDRIPFMFFAPAPLFAFIGVFALLIIDTWDD